MFWQKPVNLVNRVKSVPAPIGGLNVRDSLAAMPETDAIVLQNWWPQSYGCSVRKGYREWATGMPGQVATLATWADDGGTTKLFAWSNDSVFDVTTQGVVGAAIVTGLGSARWEWTNMVNAAGAHLIAVDGQENGIIYNSLGVARIAPGDGIVLNTWAGLSPVDTTQVVVHQHRLWAVKKNTAEGWFLPPDAVQGTFVKFDFGPLFGRGGFLQFLCSWTIDDGSGAEDFLVGVSSEGEAVVYGGTDPTDDTKWRLVGVYYIGAPVTGLRAFTKAGGDQYILTQQGLVSMATLLTSTRVTQSQDYIATKKIQSLASQLVTAFSELPGWEVRYFPRENMLLINVPSVTIGGNIQLASNQIIQSWTQFNNLDSSCWASYGNTPMFGDFTGRVLQAFEGTSDNILLNNTGGIGIVASAQQAYSYLGAVSTQKQVGMYRPTFVVDLPGIVYNSQILYDFSMEGLTVPNGALPNLGSLWGTALWNSGVWGGGTKVQQQWIQAQGMGTAASIRLVTQAQGDVLWVATDYSYISGVGLL